MAMQVRFADGGEAQGCFPASKGTRARSPSGTSGVVRRADAILGSHLADAECLLALARVHWRAKKGLFYRRGRPPGRMTLGEDRSRLRRGNGPQVLAILSDLVVGLLHQEGHTNHAAARRIYLAFRDHASNLLTLPCLCIRAATCWSTS
jgi:hypothetical protein